MYDISDPSRLKPEMFVKINTKSADESDFFFLLQNPGLPLTSFCDIRTPFLKINN